MEEAAAVRDAALTAVDDVEPDRLRDRIESRLRGARWTPGVLTVECARAVRESPLEAVADRAAGVQLIYEGLRLTRTLASEEPWVAGPTSADGGAVADPDAADLDVLVADILVARGFYLLARTEAAEAAVRVVRAFGTDQTVRRTTGEGGVDLTLEADVLELAATAGATATDGHGGPRLREYATGLAADGLPPVERVASEEVRERLAALATSESGPGDGAWTPADQ